MLALRMWPRVFLAVIGAGSLGGGVTAVFISSNGPGTAVLVAFGGALLVFSVLGDRVESMGFGNTTIRMRAAAADKYALAEVSEARGDSESAARLRAQARALMDAAGPIAAQYRAVRGSMSAGAARTREMERVMATARELAGKQAFDPAEVRQWLLEGDGEQRVTALAMMQAAPELRDFDATLETIKFSRSAFEQYAALSLTEIMLGELSAEDRARLRRVIQESQGWRFRLDSDRRRLSDRILARI